MTPNAIDVRRRVRLAGPLAALGGLVVAVTYVGRVDPHEPGHYPACPIRAGLGIFCPGCGSLRALNSLAHGDLGAAVGSNVLAVLALPLLAFWWVRWVRRQWSGRPRASLAQPTWTWILLAAVLAFTVVRNLPVGSALAP
jgi:hypothetical protein